VIPRTKAPIDDRDAAQVFKELLARRQGYLSPEQEPFERAPGRALGLIGARYVQAIIQRLNQTPEKNKLAFLDLLGLELVAAQAARVPLIFQLSEQATDSRAPARTQVAAPPPPDSTQQIVFETESATGIATARLTQVFNLWPGRDQYIDHSAAYLAGQPFQLNRKMKLENTPHEIYLAHDTLLAFAGSTELVVEFELESASGEPLAMSWEYWDGKVWRGFKDMTPACMETGGEANLDATNGLTRNGSFHLLTDCAETAKTKVYGREAFWVRGRLTEQLMPNTGKELPVVENLRLSTIIDRPLKIALKSLPASFPSRGLPKVRVQVSNEAGQPLDVDVVKLSSPEDPNYLATQTVSTEPGIYEFTLPTVTPKRLYAAQVLYSKMEASVTQLYSDPTQDLLMKVTLDVTGLIPDKAFADGTSLDLSKPFFPFGQQPEPGSTFYFKHAELFGKPGAEVRIYISRTQSAQDELKVTTPATTTTPVPVGGGGSLLAAIVPAAATSSLIAPGDAFVAAAAPAPALVPDQEELDHRVIWEYWDGRQWSLLNVSNPTADLNVTEIIEFPIPVDMAETEVNGEKGQFIRVRLARGSFGFKHTVTWFDAQAQKQNTLTYVVARPPVLSAFRIGYKWQSGLANAEQVLTYNDFQFEDRTYEARWPGSTFLPFKQVKDTTPAFYLGFDKKLPVDRLGLYLDIVEKRGETLGPALLWEYWNGSEWRRLSVEDESRNLSLPGILSFIAAEDSQPLARFGKELHWLRGRLKEDGPPGEAVVNAIFVNAVWASQQQTFNDVALGASTGLPDQVFIITQTPVNAGERLEVRELAGPRANVEWRILALEVALGDQSIIRELEEMLGREEAVTDIVKDDLRLRRDKNKRVTEVWVHWQERPHLFFSGPNDRHYMIDRARGRVIFGDSVRGRIPTAGAAVMAKQFRAGGGLVGNVAPRAVSQLLGSVPGVQAVFNARAGEGGADGETLEAFSSRAPRTIRHRGRAISPSDFETLAQEASPAVAVARAIPTRNASGRNLPGWVTLLIIPQSRERRPWPSFGLRQQVQRYIEQHAPADLAASGHIYITGPDYVLIDVEATIAPVDPAEAGEVESRARAALEDFLHPLRGGPEGRGWQPGRDVFLSDVSAVLERTKGVDFVEELTLLLDGAPQGERLAVSDERIAIAGNIRLKLKTPER
jgi:hypothetical protein